MPLGEFHDDLGKAACLSGRLSRTASEATLCDSDHPLVPQLLQNTSEGRPKLKKAQENHQVITHFPRISRPEIPSYVSGSGNSMQKHPAGTAA